MTDLYRTTKKLAKYRLGDAGFKADTFGEGFYKKFSDGFSFTVQISGMWSNVEIYCGIRFEQINETLQIAASKAGWKSEKIEMFKLNLFGLFREKTGDYCAKLEDIGIYCPINSCVSSPEEIIEIIFDRVDQLGNLRDLKSALEYARHKSLIIPFGIFTIPAGAQIVSDTLIWNWATEHAVPHISEFDREDYDRLLTSLMEMEV